MLCYTGLYIIHTHKNNTDIHTCTFTEEDMIGTHQQWCEVVASVFRRVHTSALHTPLLMAMFCTAVQTFHFCPSVLPSASQSWSVTTLSYGLAVP